MTDRYSTKSEAQKRIDDQLAEIRSRFPKDRPWSGGIPKAKIPDNRSVGSKTYRGRNKGFIPEGDG